MKRISLWTPLPCARMRIRAARLVLVASSAALTACATLAPPPDTPAPRQAAGPTSQAASLRIADSAMASGDLQVAAQLYRDVLAVEPANLQAGLGLAGGLFAAGQYGQSAAMYQDVLSHHPQQLDAELGLARLAVRQRRLDDALARYQALSASHPADPRVAAGLGVSLDLLGRPLDAQKVYRTALASNQDDQALRVNLGLSLALSSQPREGVNVLLDVASLPSATPQARQNLAFAYGMLGRDADAKGILQIDLPARAVQDNLDYYRALRARMQAPGREPAEPAP